MLALASIESFVPADHPLRRLLPLVDEVLGTLSPTFEAMYASSGRPSVPPEWLLKSAVLMALYNVRSERLFVEQLGYNMLFRWFLGMSMTEKPFDASTFSKNRQRLLEHDVAGEFFRAVVDRARAAELLNDEHFTVDGTQIQAWASLRSYRRRDSEEPYDHNEFVNFRGERRSRDTHESATEPEAMLWRKGHAQEARLSYMGHALMENDNGLVVDFELTEANGHAERNAALTMIDREQARQDREKHRKQRKRKKAQRKQSRAKSPKKKRRMTLAADRAYDIRGFIADCRERLVTPHVVQNAYGRRRSAIDGRTTRQESYKNSLRKRLLVEKIFGWMKQVAGFRRSRYRGRERTAAAAAMVAATYNLVRLTSLLPA